MESLHNLLLPFYKTSQEIDRKLPDFERKIGQPNKRKVNDGIIKIKELTKEIEDMTAECKSESSSVEQNNKTFSEIVKCAENSLDFSEALVSLLEAKFALKGYNPPERLTEKLNPELHDERSVVSNNDVAIQELVDERTYCFKEGIKEQVLSKEVKQMENPMKQKTTLFDLPESPQTPVLTQGSKKLNDCQSPALPDFLKADVKANIPISKEESVPAASYFDSVMSPNLNVPKIPLGKVEGREHATPDKFVEEDDDIVMHSRKSFFMGDPAGSPEEATVNLLKSKQLISPQSPDIGNPSGYQIGGCFMKSNHAPPNLEPKVRLDSFQSPQTPDLSALQERKYLLSPHISRERYNSLTESVKRLITYEQISSALKNIYELALSKSSHKFSVAEIERATGLAGKTKCCVLVLKTLDLIRTVAGTDLYEISN